MRFGIVGLGRMGGNLARAAMERGHDVVGYSRDEQTTARLAADGLEAAPSLDALVQRLPRPRVVLVYVPHGRPTEEVCEVLRAMLTADDVVVDGGNSHWADSQRRHAEFAQRGIRFLDLGTSGGLWGARHGACFMAGGDPEAFRVVEPLLQDLAFDRDAVIFVGVPGSGHFVKLIHNAIEFGMVQAIAEGVELLERSEFELDLPALFHNWNHGSVIRSWLVELMRDALQREPRPRAAVDLRRRHRRGQVGARLGARARHPVAGHQRQPAALMAYRDLDWPAAKAVALLRRGYGGHPVHRAEEQLVRS